MKELKLETMLGYRYLSDLKAKEGKLLFIETMADIENNDYIQSLHVLDPNTKEDNVILKDKRISTALLDDGTLLLKEKTDSKTPKTKYVKLSLDGKKTRAFTFPFAVNTIASANETTYVLEATIDVKCPDFYKLSKKKQEAYMDHLKAEEDYIVLDEYPFFYNGAGFINGTRNHLYLCDKETMEITDCLPITMDVESYMADGDTMYIMANDYESMKDIWSSLYTLDLKTKVLTKIYDNHSMFIRKIFVKDHQLYVMGNYTAVIDGSNFYRYHDGNMELVHSSEWMFYNSIGTDCRFGHSKNYISHKNESYFITADDSRSVVVKFDGSDLSGVVDGEGSVDDLTFVEDELYIIAMKDMKLEEVYHVVNENELEQLTYLNKKVLEDTYVAKPERFECFNEDAIYGWALKPKDYDPLKKYPCILDIHGGPKTAYGEVFCHEMQLWANKGYFVIFCNPHCSDGRGNEFANYIKHYGSTDYYDIMKFVDKALELYPAIDTDRLGVTGGSYGGYMTNWIVTQTNRFKCAASQRSISNRVSDYWYSDYSYDVTFENAIPRDEQAVQLFWDRSPMKYINNAKTPILFIQSTQDYRCPFPEAIQMFTALKWNGVPARICGFKGENHELSRSGKPAHRLRRLSEITNWMEGYLK